MECGNRVSASDPEDTGEDASAVVGGTGCVCVRGYSFYKLWIS